MNEALNRLFINLSKRAEKTDRQALIESFVDVGPLSAVLSTVDNQVLYGRRGTGKTHALAFLSGLVREKGDIPIYVDLRRVGSTGGMYSDGSIPLAERATRLLMDSLMAVHDELIDAAVDDHYGLNLAVVSPKLDQLADSVADIRVKGSVREERTSKIASSDKSGDHMSVGASGLRIEGNFHVASSREESEARGYKVIREGEIEHRVHLGG